MAYIGVSPSNGVRRVHTYTATASQTTFTGASSEGITLSYADTNYLDVFQNGVLLGSADYTSTSGTSVVLAQGASADDLIVIVVYDVFSVADTVSKTNGGSFDSAVTMSNNLTVSGAFTSQGIDDNADAVAITITSSEEIGIGTSSPTSSSGGKLLAIETTADEHTNVVFNTANVGKAGIIESRRTGRSGAERFAQINLQNNADKGELRFYTAPSGSDISERMRIDSNGELLINTTSTLGSGQGVLHLKGRSFNTVCAIQVAHNGEAGLDFRNSANTQVGFVTIGTSSTTYSTSSDHRLKENVTADWNATTRLKQLNPVRFNFITDADTTVDGFLAHEVQSVVPEAITGTHNEVEVWKDGEELPNGVSAGDNKLDDDGNTIPKYQGIDQSKLVPLLVKTIQELEARITALENAE